MNVPLALVLLLATTQTELPVERTKNNIKVLQGLPSSQLIPVMAFMANSLGVTCAHCHVKGYELDEKPAKDAARKMIVLQRAINDQHYGGKLVVTCNTCHQGRVVPAATPEVANAGWNASAVPKLAETIPGEEAVTRLPEATGITRRIIQGTVERYNGRDEPKSAPFTLTIDTAIDYKTELSHPPEAARALALFILQRPRPEQVRGERWLMTPDAVRRMRETPTALGNLPEQIDYENFRETDSGRLPFRTRWSRADYRVTFTVDSVQSEPSTPPVR
jgi:hypothetical protein